MVSDNEVIKKMMRDILDNADDLARMFYRNFKDRYSDGWTRYDMITWGFAMILLGTYLIKDSEMSEYAYKFAKHLVGKWVEERT
jgi:uncharacterized protein YutD